MTVNNGPRSRECIIQFSTEVSTTVGDETALRFAIDSDDANDCQAIGPEILQTGIGGGLQTVTYMGVTTIGAGRHTITPCYALTNVFTPEDAGVVFRNRCLTVECRTQ